MESTWVLRDKKYAVCADVRDDLLVVQVEEVSTADRWRGQFEPKRELVPVFPLSGALVLCVCDLHA